MATAILAISTALQFAAAFGALRLIKITGRRAAWISIATAILLMALRRTITLAHIASGNSPTSVDPAAEAVALLISLLMLVGVTRIAPLFVELQSSAAEIAKSQRQLVEFIDHTPAAVYVKDRQGRFLLINKFVNECFDIQQSTDLPRTDFDILPRDLAENNRSNDAEVIAKRQPLEFQESIRHHDGSMHD